MPREGSQDRILGISQGWKLTGAINTAERKLADKSLRHSGQGLMAWAVANARVEPKGNAIIVTKQASGSAKIDPLMAAFNAVALMSTNPWSNQPDVFVPCCRRREGQHLTEQPFRCVRNRGDLSEEWFVVCCQAGLEVLPYWTADPSSPTSTARVRVATRQSYSAPALPQAEQHTFPAMQR